MGSSAAVKQGKKERSTWSKAYSETRGGEWSRCGVMVVSELAIVRCVACAVFLVLAGAGVGTLLIWARAWLLFGGV
jgi:hypothetical protein